MNIKIIFTFILLINNSIIFAQYPRFFIETALDTNDTAPYGIAIGSDDTLFISTSSSYSDMKAFKYLGSSFIQTASLNNIAQANIGIAINNNGIIFLAHNSQGISAFKYLGDSFEKISSIDTIFAHKISISEDGTIFIACLSEGLRACNFIDNTFSCTAHIDDGSSARDVAISADGTIFLANGFDGIRAYTYDGTSFTNTAHISEHDKSSISSARDIAVGNDGIIYVSYLYLGLRAYTYDGNSFTFLDSTDQSSTHLTIGPDNTIFSIYNELSAFQFDNQKFIKLAEIHPSKTASFSFQDVVMGKDSTIFLANGDAGLFAFNYSSYVTSIDKEGLSMMPTGNKLFQNYPNPLNPTTTIKFYLSKPDHVLIEIFNSLGQKIVDLVNDNKSMGDHQVTFRCSNLPSGIYYYRLTSGSFKQTRKMLVIK